MAPTFHSDLSCPQVHLPSGAAVCFDDHQAVVDDARVAGELRDHLSDPALSALGIREGGCAAPPAAPPAAPAAPDTTSTGDDTAPPAKPAAKPARKPAAKKS